MSDGAEEQRKFSFPAAPGAAEQSGRPWPGGSRWRVDTRNQDHGARALRRAYGIERFRVLKDDPFALALRVYQLEGISLERTRFPGVVAELTAEETTVVRVVKTLAGQVSISYGHRRFRGDGPWLLPPRTRTVRLSDPDLLSMSLSLPVLQQRAAALLGLEEFGLRFHSGVPVSRAMAEYLVRAMVAAWRDQLPNAQAMVHRLVRAQVYDQLVTAVLHTFPSTFLDHPSAPTRGGPAPEALRRSVAFMEEHLGEALTVAQIAAAARMSPRGLQAAYQREMDITPMAHLRSLRLEAAHADLLAADPITTTVAEIAARWGFTHLGRFAAAYRQRYGRNPGTTLGT